MGCQDIEIKDNGVLTLNGGMLKDVGKMIFSNGGQYVPLAGIKTKCSRSYFVIPTPDGKGVILCL